MPTVKRRLRSTVCTWRASQVPHDMLDRARVFGPMRGDEIFTEAMRSALARRDDRCAAFVMGQDHKEVAVGVVLDDGRTGWMVETAAPREDPQAHHELLEAITSTASTSTVVRWRPPTTLPGTRYPAPARAVLERTVVQMRGKLPLVGDFATPAAATFHSFASAGPEHHRQDFIDTVVGINNAAFDGHPEQGAMTPASIAALFSSPWFDPAGLIVARIDAVASGFVWMKCDHGRPAELYVVAVDPLRNTRGLGRALVHAGFAHAVDAHGATEAMLFVDATNQRAVGLYESLGFTAVSRQDVLRITPGGA